MTEDEVYSYTSMIAIFRSSWWPSGVLTEMNPFQLALLTNDEVIRVTMASSRTRQVIDATSASFAGPGIVWSADDSMDPTWKYLLLVNIGAVQLEVGVDFAQLALPTGVSCEMHELWNGTALGKSRSGGASASLRPHASLFLKLSDCR